MNLPKDARVLERVIKGFANHNRLLILDLLSREPELSVLDISEKLTMGYENASDHVRKMAIAGLLLKRNEGPAVRHKLTPLSRVYTSVLQKTAIAREWYNGYMDVITNILNTILNFLLQFLTLIINFFISILQLILHFAQSLVGGVH